MKVKLLSTAAAGALVVWAIPAAAQGSDATGANGEPKPAVTDDSGISDIVVTARRRSESIIAVPVSVTALSSEALQSANISSLADIGRVAPSLRSSPIAGRLGVLSFTIRGMSETGGQITSDPAVGVYFADAIQTRAQGAGRSFYDLDSVQVLKGPQGTLFGRNLTGGAILIQPKAPVLGEVEGYVQAIYGSYDRREVQGALNIPLGDKFAVRVAGNLTRRDGYINNLNTGSKLRNDHTDSFRVSLLAEPSDEFRNTLIIDGYKGSCIGCSAAVPVAVNPAVDTPVNRYAPRLAALQRQQGRSIYDVEETFDNPASSSNYGVTNTSVLEIGGVTMKNIFNWRRVRSDDTGEEGLPQNLVTVRGLVRARQITDEFQVLGSAFDDKLDYIVGAYYFWESGVQTGLVASLGGQPRVTIGDATNESKSLFAQLDYHFTPQLTLTAGARYTWDDRSLYQQVIEPTGIQTVKAVVSEEFKKPTWTVSLNYQPNSDTLLYVANRRGYRSGGFNSGATSLAALAPVQPEVLTDYEIGFKTQGSIGGMRYRTTIAAFHSQFDDIQRNLVALIGTPPAPTRVLLNAAKATVNGGEFEATLIPIPELELSGFVGYTDAKYKSFADPISGADLSNLPFSQTPKWTYRLAAKINLPLPAEIGDISLNADYSHQSKILITDAAILPGYEQPGYGLLSMRLNFSNIMGSNVRMALFGTNLTKAKPTLAGTPFYGAPFGVTSLIYGDPRMYGVELGFSF